MVEGYSVPSSVNNFFKIPFAKMSKEFLKIGATKIRFFNYKITCVRTLYFDF